MKIDCELKNSIDVDEVPYGHCFLFESGVFMACDGTCGQSVDEMIVVNLETGEIGFINDTTKVLPINLRVVKNE